MSLFETSNQRRKINITSFINKNNSSMCGSLISIISCVVFIAIIAALALALGLYFGYFTEDDIESATGIDVPSLPPFFFNDPFEGVPPESTAKWSNSGSGGLALSIINHCQDQWDGEFSEAVQDWDNGNPDALTLSTQKMDYDADCSFQDGIMKVCNKDYGETGWKGLNEYMVDGSNTIVNSRAKMNEYYLNGASSEERLYVMCHEIGHGFGLAHTDESFVNANLGNCLDYTNSFTDEQIRPGTINYERLEEKYGTVNRRGLAEADYGEGGQQLPDWLHEEYARHSDLLSSGNRDDLIANGWVLLDQSDFGAEYALGLGEGYYVRVAMLLAN